VHRHSACEVRLRTPDRGTCIGAHSVEM
jgi:hypothetical protein